LLCGVAAPVLWMALIVFGDLARADISPITDFISELGERGSSTEAVMRWAGFGLTGLLYVWFAAALPSGVTSRWRAAIVAVFVAIDGLGRIGAGVHPCDPGCDGTSRDQELHRLFATVAFCSGIIGTLAAGVLWRSWFAAAVGLSATIFLLLMTWSDNPIDAHGLFERLATGVLSLWMVVFALGIRHGPNLGRIDP
jgi:hypothetical membrane protein